MWWNGWFINKGHKTNWPRVQRQSKREQSTCHCKHVNKKENNLKRKKTKTKTKTKKPELKCRCDPALNQKLGFGIINRNKLQYQSYALNPHRNSCFKSYIVKWNTFEKFQLVDLNSSGKIETSSRTSIKCKTVEIPKKSNRFVCNSYDVNLNHLKRLNI